MLKVIGTHRSRAMRVLWALEELGLEYEHDPAGPRSPAILAVNPSGKVPAFVTDEGVVTDSMAILHYLADREGALTEPAGSFARARQDQFTFFALDELDGVLWTAARHGFILPPEKRVEAVRPICREELTASFGLLGDRLGDSPFAAGARFTVADILIWHCAYWAGVAKVEMPAHAGLTAYLARIGARPALARAREKAEAREAAAKAATAS